MTEPDEDEEAARAAAVWAFQQATGERPSAVSAETEGLSNQVFRIDARNGRFIVRLGSSPDKLDVFERERKVIARVREIGVPVAEVVALGLAGDRPFMIARRVPGETALHHPRRLEVLKEMGRLAARIHTLRTAGYGVGFAWPDEPPSGQATFADWLNSEIDARGRLDTLRRLDLISRRQLAALNAALAEVEGWDELPVLHHGDLRLKNVLVDDDGNLQAVIDWDNSLSSVGPHWDMSIALHDLSIDAKEEFLAGYGMPEKAVREAASVWRLFNALNYAPTVAELAEQDDRAGLERLRTRLSGALDLYASA
jgi:hygromycin-B 4-O-kinase